MGVANNNQRGTGERVREKMLQIGEKARATIDHRAISSLQANKGALRVRVDAAVREERLKAQEVERRSAKYFSMQH